MEEVRHSPNIHQFASIIDPVPVLFQKVNMFGILTLERAGDFRVAPNWIASEHCAILPNRNAHIFERRFRSNSIQFTSQWNNLRRLRRFVFWSGSRESRW